MPGKRIAAALSGGVDSAVAAALLLDQGYDVIGITLRLWHEDPLTAGPTHDPTDGARQVAERLGISFHIVDAEVPFKQFVVDRFVAAYGSGHTPNPCLYCNRHIKFGFLLECALALGAQRLATGHYARTQRTRDETTWQLLKGRDRRKEQSYFLYMLGQQELARAMFPLGEWTKDRVRTLAQETDLPAAHAIESQDLCFVRDGDYRRFLREHAPQMFVPGPILDQDGQKLGRHHGLAQYTIGQRRGIGIAAPEALYVLCLDTRRNALIVGTKQELGRKTTDCSGRAMGQWKDTPGHIRGRRQNPLPRSFGSSHSHAAAECGCTGRVIRASARHHPRTRCRLLPRANRARWRFDLERIVRCTRVPNAPPPHPCHRHRQCLRSAL